MSFSHLLSHTDSLLDQMFWFEQTIEKPKAASHRGVAIKYIDLKEKKDAFIHELKSTALDWVYSRAKYQQLFDDEMSRRGKSPANIHSYIQIVAEEKFRKGSPQGQFGELLLFNFVQHFLKAPPLLRKMKITTNPALERNGADAIHYNQDSAKQHLLILGESKCYESKYKFNAALDASIKSIITSFNNIEKELVLYYMDDFIDAELEMVAQDFLRGKLANARFELVCLIAYEETKSVDASSEHEIRKNIEDCLIARWNDVADDVYEGIRKPLIERINYIVFPVWGLETLLSAF
jgi:hypothetical protein